MKRRSAPPNRDVDKKPKTSPTTSETETNLSKTNLEDLTDDSLHQILDHVFFYATCYEILGVFTVSKRISKVSQNSPLLSKFLQILSSSEIGQQIPFKDPPLTWKFFFKKFFNFLDLQYSQFELCELVNYHFGNDATLNMKNFQLKNQAILREFDYHSKKTKFLYSKETLSLSMTRIGKLDMKILEKEIWNSLLSLRITNHGVFGIPSCIGLCSSIEVINFRDGSLQYIPSEIGNCKNLLTVNFSGNLISELPEDIGNWGKLWQINLSNNKLKSLPKTIENWISLQLLDISFLLFFFFLALLLFTNLKLILSSLPKTIENWISLQLLDISDNYFQEIPNIKNFKDLKYFDFSFNYGIKKIPANIVFTDFPMLRQIDITSTGIDELALYPSLNGREDMNILTKTQEKKR